MTLPFDLTNSGNGKKTLLALLAEWKKHIFIGLIALVLLATGGGGVYLYMQNSRSTPDQIAQKQAEQQFKEQQKKNNDMLATVKEQIALPTNEDPIFATVSNRDDLQNQEFFQEAQNGDRILLYPKNKKAFLYRPATQKVLAVAPLQYNVGKSSVASVAAEATSSAAVSTSPNPTIVPHGKILINQQ